MLSPRRSRRRSGRGGADTLPLAQGDGGIGDHEVASGEAALDLDLVQSGRVDLSGMLTHRFPLDHWHDALRALSTQENSGAVKVAFEPATTG